jgi:hypothetical protein
MDSEPTLCHNRLRNMSAKGMKVIHSKNFLSGLKCVSMDFYEIYMYEKQKRFSFLKDRKH